MKKITRIISFFILLLSINMSYASGFRRFAFVVGMNDGGKGREKLKYAVRDAEKVKNTLKKMGGVSKEDLFFLKNPDLSQFKSKWDLFKTKVESNQGLSNHTEIVFYYSGHANESGILLGNNQVGYRSLRHSIQSLDADVRIVILDSCESGEITRAKGGKPLPPFLLDSSSKMEGNAYLTSSSADEASQESDSIKGSFFTHYLVDGWKGSADRNEDGKITLNESYQFAYDETLRRTQKTRIGVQHPNLDIKMKGSGDVVLTDIHRATSILHFEPSIEGHIFIRAQNESLISDFHKQKGKDVSIGVEPKKYVIALQSDNHLYQMNCDLNHKKEVFVKKNQFKPISAELTAIRGDTNSLRSGQNQAQVIDNFPFSLVDSSEKMVANLLDSAKEKLKENLSPTSTINKSVSPANIQPTPLPDTSLSPSPILSLHLVSGVSTSDQSHIALALISGKQNNLAGLALTLFGGFTVRNNFSGLMLSPVYNIGGENNQGFQIAYVFNTVNGSMNGLQSAFVFNWAQKDFNGVQSSFVYNVSKGKMLGVQSTFGANISEQDFYGIQGAFGASITGQDFNGIQGAFGASVAGQDFYGIQGAFGASVAGQDFYGIQGAFGANVAGQDFYGIQGAFGANVAGRDAYGIQGAFGANIAGRNLYGIQGAFGGNIAGQDFYGIQGAFGLNIAKRKSVGLQLGLLNLAGEHTGVQIGVINVARHLNGIPLGLFSFSGNGNTGIYYGYQSRGYHALGLKGGSRLFFNILEFSKKLNTDLNRVAYGIGTHLGKELFVEIRTRAILPFHTILGSNHYTSVYTFMSDVFPGIIQDISIAPGVQFFNHLTLLVGIRLNMTLTQQIPSLAEFIPPEQERYTIGSDVTAWQGFFTEIQWTF